MIGQQNMGMARGYQAMRRALLSSTSALIWDRLAGPVANARGWAFGLTTALALTSGALGFEAVEGQGPFAFHINANIWGMVGVSPNSAGTDRLEGPNGTDLPRSAFKQKSALRFNPEYLTQSGITLGARLDIASTNRYDSSFARASLTPPQGRNVPYIDKQYLYMESPYGRLSLGQVTGVGDQTASYAPISNEITGINASSLNMALELAPAFFDNQHYVGRPYTSTTNFANDSAKIMYFTPRVAGVQLAASYTPRPDAGGYARAAANLRFNTFAGAPNGPAIGLAPSGLRTQDNIREAYEVGVNYDKLLGPVGVKGSLTFGAARDPLALGGRQDTSALSIGLNLAIDDFTLGGAYGYIEGAVLGRALDPLASAGNLPAQGLKRERESFDIGGTYTVSDWTLGLNYAYGSARYPALGINGATARTPSTNGTEFSFDYTLANGVDLISAVQFINFDAGNLSGERQPNKSTTNLLVGTQIKF